MSDSGKKDLVSDAKSFLDSLGNVFVLKKRDAQSRHLLNQAKTLIEALLAENQRLSSGGGTPRVGRSGSSMGQLWVKLDELKRENEELKRQLGKSHEERPTTGKSQGPGEVIISELHKSKTENSSLRAELEKVQKTVQEMHTINTNLQDEYKRLKISLDAANRSLENSRREYKSLETNLNTAKSDNEALKQRLNSSPSKTVIRRDNRQFENINERCRPSVIAMKYDTLESQEWVDAKESLEDTTNRDEEEIAKFLCFMLMKTYEASQSVYDKLQSTVSVLLKHPTLADSLGQNGLPPIKQGLTNDLRDGILMTLRQNFDDIETSAFVKVAVALAQKSGEFPYFVSSCLENKTLGRYLHACARVTWQMVIQTPAMCLTTRDTVFNIDRHRIWWSCDKGEKSRINFFVWPALYDYEEGALMVKGCVHAS